ncbi:hypothetical protein ES708_26696 [subsurface metagenome]
MSLSSQLLAPISDEVVNAHVGYHRLLDQEGIGATSAEVILFRVDNDTYNKSRLDEDIWGSDYFKEDVDRDEIPKWRIQVKYRSEDEQYDVTIPKKYKDMIDDVVNALPAPEGMNVDFWQRKTAEEKRDIMVGIDRDTMLAGNEIYRKDRLRIKAYEKDFPDVEGYVTYYELEAKGYRQERMLIEDKAFGKAMHDIKGIDLPDPKKIPAVGWDRTYEKYKDEFDKFWGLGDHESEYYIEDIDKRAAEKGRMRYDAKGNPTDFYKAEKRLDAYKFFVPEDLIPVFVEYYTSPKLVKPDDWEHDGWYEDDWFLMEHPRFCQTMVDLKIWLEEREFSKVPTREVFELYKTYRGDGMSAQACLDMRARYPELDAWLLLTKKVSLLVGDRGKKEAPKTPWEEHEEIERFIEKF